MSYRAAVVLSAFSCLILASSGCIVDPYADLDQAIDDSRAALGTETDAMLEMTREVGLPDDQASSVIPEFGTDEIQLYGEVTVRGWDPTVKKPIAGLASSLKAVSNGVMSGAEDLERALVTLGRTTQTNEALNQPVVRFTMIQLGYRVGHILCLANLHKQKDPGDPLLRAQCDFTMAFATMWESYPFQSMLLDLEEDAIKQANPAIAGYMTAISNVIKLGTPGNGEPMPGYLKDLVAKHAEMKALLTTRATNQGSFGALIRNGVATGAGAAAGAALHITPQSPSGTHHDPALALVESDDAEIAKVQGEIDAAMQGFFESSLLDASALDGLAGAVDGAADAIEQDKGSSDALLSAAKQMQETQMSFSLQYLSLKEKMENENRQYLTVARVLKTKHDTVKNSINNVR